jgi:hypothetical protein
MAGKVGVLLRQAGFSVPEGILEFGVSLHSALTFFLKEMLF